MIYCAFPLLSLSLSLSNCLASLLGWHFSEAFILKMNMLNYVKNVQASSFSYLILLQRWLSGVNQFIWFPPGLWCSSWSLIYCKWKSHFRTSSTFHFVTQYASGFKEFALKVNIALVIINHFMGTFLKSVFRHSFCRRTCPPMKCVCWGSLVGAAQRSLCLQAEFSRYLWVHKIPRIHFDPRRLIWLRAAPLLVRTKHKATVGRICGCDKNKMHICWGKQTNQQLRHRWTNAWLLQSTLVLPNYPQLPFWKKNNIGPDGCTVLGRGKCFFKGIWWKKFENYCKWLWASPLFMIFYGTPTTRLKNKIITCNEGLDQTSVSSAFMYL